MSNLTKGGLHGPIVGGDVLVKEWLNQFLVSASWLRKVPFLSSEVVR